MRITIPIFVATAYMFALLFLPQPSQAQLWEEGGDDVIEEITVTGDPSDLLPFPDYLGNYFSFGLVDIDETLDSTEAMIGVLNQFTDAYNEAAEQECGQKIEQWRQQCRDTYFAEGTTLCLIWSYIATRGIIRSLFPPQLRRDAETGGAVAVGSACVALNSHAFQQCDRIADSEAAPRVAQCAAQP